MKLVFWAAASLIAYTYAGYVGWLWLRRRWRSQPVKRAACAPFVSLVMVVRNEAGIIQHKLRNLLDLNYPQDRSEIVVVSDGSTDGTNHSCDLSGHRPGSILVVVLVSHGHPVFDICNDGRCGKLCSRFCVLECLLRSSGSSHLSW